MFLHLFNRTNAPAEIGNFYKFLLDCFQPLMPLAVRDLSLRIIAAAPSILGIQFLQLCDLGPQASDLFSKHFQVVHVNQDSIWIGSQVITSVQCMKEL